MTEQVAPPIDSADELAELSAAINDASLIALDTEFVRERTYYPRLCLIQVATDDLIACVDILADLDLTPLWTALFDTNRTWVLHSARQDLEVIWNVSGKMPQKLIDTQLAGALVGFPPQQSLQDLLKETIGVSIDKDMSRTDWSKRPLPEPALRYALDDVRYLLSAWRALVDRLGPRLSWLEEDCRRLVGKSPITSTTDLLGRLSGAGSLDADGLAAAIAMIEWREREAQRVDRPRRWILSDEQLLNVARARPDDTSQLAAVQGMPRKIVSKNGQAIIDALSQRNEEATRNIIAARGASSRPDRSAVKTLQVEVRDRAQRLGIYAEVLATRRDISALAAGETPEGFSDGWRGQVMRGE